MENAVSSASDQAAYFLNLAVIGATLFGLTLIALASFLPELMRRYDESALAAFHDNDVSRFSLHTRRPYSLSDREVLDGEPLVIFIAYSIGVSWNLFILPLAIGLTAGWTGAPLWICGWELLAFLIFLSISFRGRQVSIAKLKPYLTREERLWPILTSGILILFGAATALIFLASLGNHLRTAAALAFWTRLGLSNANAMELTLKVVCILSLLLGTYTLNKEIFIYFKVTTTEGMRRRWLSTFLLEYKELKEDVNKVMSRLPEDSMTRRQLKELWNGGVPCLFSNHDYLGASDAKPDREALWNELLRGRLGTPDWMLDITKLAFWKYSIEDMLSESEPQMNQDTASTAL